eukprot:1145539-Pelagomonas_calceolata.AAC.2
MRVKLSDKSFFALLLIICLLKQMVIRALKEVMVLALCSANHLLLYNKLCFVVNSALDMCASGFAHWRAQCLDGTTRMLEAVEGLDYFNVAVVVVVAGTKQSYGLRNGCKRRGSRKT